MVRSVRKAEMYMLKICNKCGEEKELEKFIKSKEQYGNKCKECKNKARRTGKPVGNKGIFRSRGRGGRYDCKFREEIKERDGHKCTRCGNKENIHVHHIVRWKDSIELRFDPSNLITLCAGCHAIVEPKLPKNPVVWNKGKKGIYSEKTLSLWSEQRKGIPSWNKDMKGYRAGTKRKPHTEKSKIKMREKMINKPWSEARRLAHMNKKEVL